MLQVLECTEVQASGGEAAPGKQILGPRHWVVFLGRMAETALTAQTPVHLVVAPLFNCQALDQATRSGRVSTRSKCPSNRNTPLKKQTGTFHKLPTIRQHPDEESNKNQA